MPRQNQYQQELAREKVEIEEQYEQTMTYPVVKTTWWRSLDETQTFYFHEVDPARNRLEPVGTLLGDVPSVIVAALAEVGYTYSTQSETE